MRINRRIVLIMILAIVLAEAFSGGAALAQSVRVKDIAAVEGVRGNQLLGYGLIVGLEGTGDTQQTKFTARSVANMLQTYGIEISGDTLKVKNVAAVMVTADLPAFARPGTTIDVAVSSLGDARSLQGGTLLQTPLKAANGQVYAVAQGPISIGGFSAGGGGSSVSKNHSTVGRVPGGAIVEQSTTTNIAPQNELSIALERNDFTTAVRLADAVNEELGGHFASPEDASTVSVRVPPEYEGSVVSLIANIESLELEVDTCARVVVNERTGTVVIGSQARILPVAVSHGSLTVEIDTDYLVSQPEPLGTGTTAVVPDTKVEVTEDKGHLIEVGGGSSIEDLVRALNALRVTPRDLIAILQAIKQAGALQAQLEVI